MMATSYSFGMDDHNFGTTEVLHLKVFSERLSGLPPQFVKDVCFVGGYCPDRKNQWAAEIEKAGDGYRMTVSGSQESSTYDNLDKMLHSSNFPATAPVFPRTNKSGRCLAHLTKEQLVALDAIVDKFPLNVDKPTFSEYEKAMKSLGGPIGAIKHSKTVASICLNNCKPCVYHAHEVIPNQDFDARRDLKPGYALYGMADSGGNHVVLDAACERWTAAWNYMYGGESKAESISLPGRTREQPVNTTAVGKSI